MYFCTNGDPTASSLPSILPTEYEHHTFAGRLKREARHREGIFYSPIVVLENPYT